MNPTLAFTGSATSYSAGNGDVSVVAVGSTQGEIRFKNISDIPIKAHFRKTGSTDDEFTELSPGESSGNYTLALTSARTIDYFVEGGGSVECYVVDYGSSGVVISTISVDTVIAWLEMHKYTVSANGNLTSAEVQLCLDSVSAKAATAATQFKLRAGYLITVSSTLSAYYNDIVLKGTVAQALYLLRNIGASRGLTSDMIIISNETANNYQIEFDEAITNMKAGINVGA